MSTRKSPHARPPSLEPAAPSIGKTTSGTALRGTGAAREEMPTLVDDVELEAARVASTKRSSAPPPPLAEDAAEVERPLTDHDIDITWAPDSELLDPEELFSKFVRLLGPFTRVPTITVTVERLSTLSLDNRMGFLVALIDGTTNIQTLLDVAGMPPREVLHAIVTLRDLGILALRDE